MDFSQLLPGIHDWVTSLPKTPPFAYLQDIYALFGAIHLIGLAMLGGAVILLNLRLLNAGMTTDPTSVVERGLRPWLIIGTAIVLVTGIIIGALNSEKLYYSTAFFAKMVAMVAALIFSFGVTNVVASSEGKTSGTAIAFTVVAGLLWLVSLGVFSVTDGLNPGVFHMIAAGFAILIIAGKHTRWIAAAIAALLYGGILVMYFVVGMDNADAFPTDMSRYSLIAGAIALVALLGFEISKGEGGSAPLTRVIALFSILCWVTVAAAGRWIGFS